MLAFAVDEESSEVLAVRNKDRLSCVAARATMPELAIMVLSLLPRLSLVPSFEEFWPSD